MFGSLPSTRYLDFLIELDRRDKLIDPSSGQARCEPTGDISEYTVAIRYRWSDSQADTQPRVGLARFDWRKLAPLDAAYQPEAYGQLLTESLFADRVVREAYLAARSMAESSAGNDAAGETETAPLRLRLAIAPDACELHNLYWETLADPLDKNARLQLSASERVLFSRYLSSPDMRPVRMRARASLHALVMVANPVNLDEFNLEPVPEGEPDKIVAAFGKIPAARLPAQGKTASLSNLVDSLRAQPADILFLVCHGRLEKGEPSIYLEDQAGRVKVEKGIELVEQLRDLPSRPRLVVLVSCSSAARPGANMLTALGPRLVEAGIPAVVAMHGNISMTAASSMMPVFFDELERHGQIDRALAIARRKFKEEADAWMPVLFMRLRDGMIWYEPGFFSPSGERIEFPKWPGLIANIRSGRCTPILGPGVYEWLTGSEREIARRWAQDYNFPLSRHQVDSLPEVAQFLSVEYGEAFPYDELADLVKKQIQQVHGHDLPAGLNIATESLDRLVTAAGLARRQRDPLEPNKLIASMPFRVVLTANPGSLLADALQEAGTLAPADGSPAQTKSPRVLLCPWNEIIRQMPKENYLLEDGFIPSEARPLVYHVFGRLDPLESIVLAEDDYFNFLINLTSGKTLIPSAVDAALTNTSLLFIGFQMEDWNFRVLMRYILSLPNAAQLKRRVHVAVQLKPDPERIIHPARAYQYLENSIKREDFDFSIYWGSAEDFVSELYQRWQSTI